MPNRPKTTPLPQAFLAEIAEELLSLEGGALDQFLLELGMDPGDLLAQSADAMAAAQKAQGRQRFEQARARVKAKRISNTATILSFDIAKKRALLDAIRARGEKTGDMTMAARNQKIESESDLDSVLEACLKLGVIDASGELKD
ncbi:MAG: hypothetical protein ACKVRO_07595 [Micropepsaceae bacterium]